MEEDPAPVISTTPDPLSGLKYALLSPQRIVLQQDASIQGIDFAIGTELIFESGRIAEIGSPIDLCINGIWWSHQTERLLTKEGEKIGRKILKLQLYPNGQVRQGILLEDTTIGNICFQGGKLIALYENGTVFRGYPKNNLTIDGISYLAWGESRNPYLIKLYENGEVAKGYLEQEALIDGFHCAADQPVEFFPSRKLKSCVQETMSCLYGIECRPGFKIELYESGRVHKITPLYVERDTCLSFYENGAVKIAIPTAPTAIDGIECAAAETELYPNGKLKRGVFAKPTTLHQISYIDRFALDEKGLIAMGTALEDFPLVLSLDSRYPIYRLRNAIFKLHTPVPQGSLSLSKILALRQTGHLRSAVRGPSKIQVLVSRGTPFEKSDANTFSFELAEDLNLFGVPLKSGDHLVLNCAKETCEVVLSGNKIDELRQYKNHFFPYETCITFNWDGQLLSARSRHPIRIQGIECQTNTPILFYPSGELFQANIVDLYRDLAPESLIQLTPKGKLQAAYLSKRDFENFSCARQTWLLFDDRERLIRFSPDDNSSATLSWKEDGSLETFDVRGQRNLIAEDINVAIPHDITLQNIHCKQGWFCFSSDGQLKEASLAPESLREFGFEDLSLEIRGDFADDILFEVPEETRIQGIPCTGQVHFYPSKRLKTVTLAKDWVVASHLFLKNTQMTFSDQDPRTILSFMPPEPCSSAGIISKNQTVIHLHFNGALKQITLGAPFDIWAQDTDLHFRENGTISQGTLGQDVGELKRGTQVRRTEEGSLSPLNPLKRFSVDDFFATDDEPATKKRG